MRRDCGPIAAKALPGIHLAVLILTVVEPPAKRKTVDLRAADDPISSTSACKSAL